MEVTIVNDEAEAYLYANNNFRFSELDFMWTQKLNDGSKSFLAQTR